MKTPLRFQITESNCDTISLQNAISFLFERKEIPAELLKAIHEYTLDCHDKYGNLGQGGTSREAIDKLTKWISEYSKKKDFGIICERLTKEEVILDKMQKCIDDNGCIFVRLWQECEHYVIITKIKSKKAYIFDPYYLDKEAYKKDKEVKMIFNKPFTHNRIVSLKRLFSETKKDFSMGPIEKRECVLIERTK